MKQLLKPDAQMFFGLLVGVFGVPILMKVINR